MVPNPHGHALPQSPPQSWHAAPPPQHTFGPDGNGVQRGEVFLFRASTARRWWARILDGVFVIVPAVAAVLGTAVLSDKGQLSDSIGMIVLFAAYPVMLVVGGALYGCSRSPGQAITGVVSLRSSSGHRVGFWRGTFRYLGVGFFPVTLVVMILSILDMPDVYDEPVRVYRR
ncbi:hypothetical protein CFN78_00125 [Amycolatopsis antarctica]|uniref:RDD domain-containing protein n=1 Tax=Amycolatopsis antarctica TaxID=1854586 RepID=A0A263D836_9PSEU|nr:RDD family protein [Amycolatopsis antarctica]OZM74694.1 hypothetical protein CFN78_00125 [Amycolatopsis antarctica]